LNAHEYEGTVYHAEFDPVGAAREGKNTANVKPTSSVHVRDVDRREQRCAESAGATGIAQSSRCFNCQNFGHRSKD
uniref:CCHC-type domain-containing protein n=1 Tax=Heligmosomoides polygyrus TaxID=6339 RepID=A0A183F9N8_HELPZ